MENNTNQLNANLCKKNCGFYGNAACDGYCSKCYKDHVKRQNSGSAAGRVTPTTGLTTTTSSTNRSQILVNNNNNNNNNNSNNSNNNNNNNEIPVITNTVQVNNEEQQQIGVVQAKPSTPEPTSVSAITTNSTSSSTSSNTVSSTPILQTQTSSSSSSVPIPIPSRQQSAVSNNLNNTSNDNDIAMSVPNDLISSSLLSTSTSPIGAGTSVGDSSIGTSIGSEKKKRTRCVLESCKRKVGLTGFDCRCGGLYCWEHRYSDKHNCQFDYKELGQDQIRKNNPIVIGEKIQKI